MEKLRKILECGICLNTVHNPKQLKCNHSFCKSCLDKVLTFAPDGSASIKCPVGCELVTTISPAETTNVLPINFMCKNAVDLLIEEGRTPRDNGKGKCSSCSRPAVRHCGKCDIFKCEQCEDHHDGPERKKRKFSGAFVPVHFGPEASSHCSGSSNSADSNSGVVYCKEHMTEAEYLCCGNEYVCIYCIQRSHKEHEYEPLVDVEQSLRSLVQEKINSNLDIDTRKKDAEKQIKVVEEDLAKAFRRRKVEYLLDIISSLDDEEEKIRKEFKKISRSYVDAFDSVVYFQECLIRDRFEFLLQRRSIEEKLKTGCFRSVDGIPGVAVSLITNDIGGFRAWLKTYYCSNNICKKFLGDFNIPPTDHDVAKKELVEELTKILKKINGCVDSSGEEDDKILCRKEQNGKRETVASDYNRKTSRLELCCKGHECEPEPKTICSPQSVKTSMKLSCSFKVTNVSNIDNCFWSDPMITDIFLLKLKLGPSYKNENGDTAKYVAVFLDVDYKGSDTEWSLLCNIRVSKTTQRGYRHFAPRHTKSLSFSFNKDDTRSKAWTPLLKWTDMMDPSMGYIEYDSITIESDITLGYPADSSLPAGNQRTCYPWT